MLYSSTVALACWAQNSGEKMTDPWQDTEGWEILHYRADGYTYFRGKRSSSLMSSFPSRFYALFMKLGASLFGHFSAHFVAR
jgi:hypothetical protein